MSYNNRHQTSQFQTPMRGDIELQRHAVYNSRRQNHDRWVADHQAGTKFDHETSKVRAQLLVNEAWKQEKVHLQHQLKHSKSLIRAVQRNHSIAPDAATPSPKSTRARLAAMSPNMMSPQSGKKPHQAECHSPDHGRQCPCISAPVCRRINAKYRAMALMKGRFDDDKLEMAVETIRNTYLNDHEMLEDLLYRYGTDGDDEEVSPKSQLRCVEEKIETCDERWQEIGSRVKQEMECGADAFPRVIRNLSIMRIFLEGSQSSNYGCDTAERARRDAYHQQVLDDLSEEGTLFVTPRRVR